jgi:hypothetical protein
MISLERRIFTIFDSISGATRRMRPAFPLWINPSAMISP